MKSPKAAHEKPQLKPVDLAKKARDLARRDADLAEWEEDLNRRQAAVDDTSTVSVDLKVLQAKVDSKREELSHLEQQMETKTESFAGINKQYNKAIAESEKRKQAKLADLDSLTNRVKLVQGECTRADNRLININKEIKDRLKYQQEQEDLIEDMAQAGNIKLNEVNRQIRDLEQEYEEELKNIVDANNKLNSINDDVTLKQQDLERLTNRYNEVAEGYKAELVALREDIDKASKKHKKIASDTEQELITLRAERTELEVTKEVMAKQQADLVNQRRQLDSQRSVYGL